MENLKINFGNMGPNSTRPGEQQKRVPHAPTGGVEGATPNSAQSQAEQPGTGTMGTPAITSWPPVSEVSPMNVNLRDYGPNSSGMTPLQK